MKGSIPGSGLTFAKCATNRLPDIQRCGTIGVFTQVKNPTGEQLSAYRGPFEINTHASFQTGTYSPKQAMKLSRLGEPHVKIVILRWFALHTEQMHNNVSKPQKPFQMRDLQFLLQPSHALEEPPEGALGRETVQMWYLRRRILRQVNNFPDTKKNLTNTLGRFALKRHRNIHEKYGRTKPMNQPVEAQPDNASVDSSTDGAMQVQER